ncbi:hypothetical protein D3C85_1100580 [compost metagenome]
MDRNLTCFTPKYSLMISVIMKIMGQVNTPADITNDKCGTPNKLMSNFFMPRVSSTLNNLTPINSDNMALATKKLPRTSSKRLSFVLKVIGNKSKYNLSHYNADNAF